MPLQNQPLHDADRGPEQDGRFRRPRYPRPRRCPPVRPRRSLWRHPLPCQRRNPRPRPCRRPRRCPRRGRSCRRPRRPRCRFRPTNLRGATWLRSASHCSAAAAVPPAETYTTTIMPLDRPSTDSMGPPTAKPAAVASTHQGNRRQLTRASVHTLPMPRLPRRSILTEGRHFPAPLPHRVTWRSLWIPASAGMTCLLLPYPVHPVHPCSSFGYNRSWTRRATCQCRTCVSGSRASRRWAS